jgi:hypothetical protein
MSGPLDVHDLLVLARETLQNDLAEAIAPSGRFTAALIANALAVAARAPLEHPAADRAAAAARAAIAGFAGDGALVASIRSGALDAPSPARAAALAYATALVRRRLAVTNPSRLQR